MLGFHIRPDKPEAFNILSRNSVRFFPAIIDELHDATGRRTAYHHGGQLSVAPDEADLAELETAYEINAAQGVPVERPTPDECLLLAPGLNPKVQDALFWPENAWVDNTALTLAFVEAAEKAGASFERGNVRSVESDSGRVTGVLVNGELRPAGWVVLAAGCWSGEIGGLPPLAVEPVRGQAYLVSGQPIKRIVMSPRGYLVPKGDDQTMIGATVEWAGFEEATTLGGLAELANVGLEISPTLAGSEFIGAWAGLRPATADDLPFIGPFGQFPNLIAATGHFRNGILFAPITAELVRATILGENPGLNLQPYSPDRAVSRV